MANKDYACGLRVYDVGGGARPRLTPYKVAASTVIYANAPVITVNDGTVAMSAAVNGIKNFTGVAAHSIQSSSAIQTVMVYDDPAQRFIIQTDSDTDLTATAVGLNCDLLTPNIQNGSTRMASGELDGSQAVATFGNLGPIRILGLYERVGNSWGTHADVIVRFNNGVHTHSQYESLGL